MKKTKIILLVLYVAFILLFISSLLATRRVDRNMTSLTLMGILMPVALVAMIVVGGITAHSSGRNVVGWVIGCILVPYVCPLILALLKDVQPNAVDAGATSAPDVQAAALARKKGELDALLAQGILTDEEYRLAVSKLSGNRGAATSPGAGT